MATILRRRTVPVASIPSRPAPAPEPEPEPSNVLRLVRRTSTVQQQAPARRLRFATANNAATRAEAANKARAEIDVLLQSIAKIDQTIDDAVAQTEQIHAQIEQHLRASNLSAHSDGYYEVGIVESLTRQSRTIDPKKYKNQVSNDVFFSTIDVSIGKAAEHLAQKEIDAISEVVPARSLGFKFKIKKIERKVK